MAQTYSVELVVPDGETIRLDVEADESVWDAAHRQGLVLPSSCLQGWCTTCAAKVLEGDFDPADALRYYDLDRQEGFILLCTAKPRSDMRILIHQKDAMRAHRLSHKLPTPRG